MMRVFCITFVLLIVSMNNLQLYIKNVELIHYPQRREK